MAKAKLKEHRINRDWCKGCGICVAFCPKTVLALDDQDKAMAVRIEDCIACRLCELRCPDLAIEVEIEDGDQKTEVPGRRSEVRGLRADIGLPTSDIGPQAQAPPLA